MLIARNMDKCTGPQEEVGCGLVKGKMSANAVLIGTFQEFQIWTFVFFYLSQNINKSFLKYWQSVHISPVRKVDRGSEILTVYTKYGHVLTLPISAKLVNIII